MATRSDKPMSLRSRIAERLLPINRPLMLNLPDFSIVGATPQIVRFNQLECPIQDLVVMMGTPLSVEVDVFLAAPQVEIISDVNNCILATPEIETLFEPIKRPSVRGKRYFEGADPEQPVLIRDPALKCRHDLPQDLCQTCRDQRATRMGARNARKQPTAVDVFEQLWYILQPPILSPTGQPTVFPNGLKPYPFQIAGVDWLVKRKEALLADEMGLGKTIQAIIAMRVLFRNGSIRNALVVCPASMTITWERELKSWAPELRRSRIHGSRYEHAEAWRAPSQVYVVSYETLARDFPGIATDQFDLCILDEAQKIKNTNTANHRGVKGLDPKWRWSLSGTPIENSTQDAVSIFSFLVPGLFAMGESPNTTMVREKIEPYTLRRSIEDCVVEMPELIHQEHWLRLTDSQRSRYEQAKENGVEYIKSRGDTATRINVLALISKLKQICNYDEESGESCKLEFLKEELEKVVAQNDKALVFSQYPVKTLTPIDPELADFKPIFFDGSLSVKAKDDAIQRFQYSDENQVMLISIRAGGTGLTLTKANHVFHFDHWWNPAVVDQGTARIRRIGQKKPVFAHSLYALDTVEEQIALILEAKRDTFKDVFGNLGSGLDDKAIDSLSDEDLFGLFDLKPPGKEDVTKFLDMSPEEFERSVCTLFDHLRYKLSVTQRTRDGGIDLDGYRLGVGGGRVIVQCKRYSGTVSVSAVRELFGVVSGDNSITEGFLVTTGRFSNDAKDFAKNKRITLVDGIELETRCRNVVNSHPKS